MRKWCEEDLRFLWASDVDRHEPKASAEYMAVKGREKVDRVAEYLTLGTGGPCRGPRGQERQCFLKSTGTVIEPATGHMTLGGEFIYDEYLQLMDAALNVSGVG